MDSDYVVRARLQVAVHMSAARQQQLQGGGVVIHEGIPYYTSMIHVQSVATLSHKVEDLEVARVALVKETVDVVGRVAVGALPSSSRRVAHCDDPRSDVRQVEIKAILLESFLVQRDKRANLVGDGLVWRAAAGGGVLVVVNKALVVLIGGAVDWLLSQNCGI